MHDGTPKRLGVVGTLVWDTIRYRNGRLEQVEEWGGVAYALSAFEAALPDDWEIVPIVKVGSDLSESAWRFLRSFPRFDVETGIRVVPQPNNRVELVYTGPERRTERLIGGVPPWLWAELGPLAGTCDALYVNFVSGFEMELDTARSLRSVFPRAYLRRSTFALSWRRPKRPSHPSEVAVVGNVASLLRRCADERRGVRAARSGDGRSVGAGGQDRGSPS